MINFIKYRSQILFFLSTFIISSANALNYEEHKYVSQKALELLIKHDSIYIDQTSIKKGIGSNFLCSNLLDQNPGKCFTLADLPALAGDHAGSPTLMKWKWFNDDFKPNYISPITDFVRSFRVVGESDCFSSETTISKIPKREEFATLMHRASDGSLIADNFSIAKLDSNYVNSAAHNCNHFRNSNIVEPVELEEISTSSYITDIWHTPRFIPNFLTEIFTSLQSENRSRGKPGLEASAWYSQFHASAIEIASYEGDTSLAAAWIFETFSLHFLQDGVSSGHIITPSDGGLSVITTTKKTHDELSENGLNVSVHSACTSLINMSQELKSEFSSLNQVCESTSFETKIYGDGELVSDKSKVTKELAIYLSYISLKEFSEAITNKKPLLPEQKPLDNYKKDPHWTFKALPNQELYKVLFSWWESGGSIESNSPMSLAAKKYFEVGKIKAVSLWPIAIKIK